MGPPRSQEPSAAEDALPGHAPLGDGPEDAPVAAPVAPLEDEGADVPVQAPRSPRRGTWATAVRILVAAAMAAATLAAAAAMLLLPLQGQAGAAAGLALAAAAALSGLAVAAGHRLEAGPRAAAGRDERRWTALKAAGILLELLGFATLAILALSVLARLGAIEAPLVGAPLQRGILLLAWALALAQGATHLAALRSGLPRERTGVRAILVGAALAAHALLCAVASLLATGQGGGMAFALDRADLPFAVLAAQGASALALAASRGLPGIPALLEGGRLGESLAGARRSAVLPVALAFALLFLVLLLFLAFGIGLRDLAGELARRPLLLGAFLFLALAFAGSLAAAARLARQERAPGLQARHTNPTRTRGRWILGVSLAAAAALAVPAALLFGGASYPSLGLGPPAWIHFFCLALLVAIGPYGFHKAREHRRIRLLEERFPDFLRDVASSHKGGLTLTQATVIASRGEYGPLTPEVQKMADQLHWNVSFNEALQRFADRVRTPLVQRAVSLILQANRSGGATTEVLLAAARDAREIKTLETERKLSMGLYTVVIYITFLVFLGVASILYSQFVPQLVAASQAAAEQSERLGGATIEGLGAGGTLRLEDFQLFYFMAAVMQGLGDGLVAGLMGQGKAVLGLRHSFAMVLMSYLTFTLLL